MPSHDAPSAGREGTFGNILLQNFKYKQEFNVLQL